jgi:DNA-binding GntR family transcriptional regulator
MSAEDRFTPNSYRVEKYLRDRIQSGDLKPGQSNHNSPSNSASAA